MIVHFLCGLLINSSTGVPTKNAKSLTPSLEIVGKEMNEGLVNLGRERCRNKVYNTIPYFNDRST